MSLASHATLAPLMVLALGIAQGEEPDPKATIAPLGQSSYRLDWSGEEGWTYLPQYSLNLVDWFYMPEIDQGVVHDPIDVTPLEDPEATNPIPLRKFFMRLKWSDFPTLDPKGADFDGDGLSNWKELTVFGTDPLMSDTDGDHFLDGQTDTDGAAEEEEAIPDGMADQWELELIESGLDPSIVSLDKIRPEDDYDHDGVTNLQEYLRGLKGYISDSDGDGYGDRLSVDEEVFLRLDEESGAIASDSSDKRRSGSLGGSPAWQAHEGVEGGALAFDGGADSLALSDDVLDGAGDLTVSLWFKTSVSPVAQTLLSSANSLRAPEFSVTLENGISLRFDTGGESSVTWTYGRSLADGLWHHVVFTRNVAAGQVALNVDGAAFGSPQTVSLPPLDVDVITLGQQYQTSTTFNPGYPFCGMLDNVRVHSVVLASEHLAEMFRPNDLDADGLPDDYEARLTGNLATLAAGGDDLDGDRLTNRQEYEAGTDPTDYYNGVTPTIELLSGGGQFIKQGERTPLPFVFRISIGGVPLANAPVKLSHLEAIGGIESLSGDSNADSLILRTNSEGKMFFHFQAD